MNEWEKHGSCFLEFLVGGQKAITDSTYLLCDRESAVFESDNPGHEY